MTAKALPSAREEALLGGRNAGVIRPRVEPLSMLVVPTQFLPRSNWSPFDVGESRNYAQVR